MKNKIVFLLFIVPLYALLMIQAGGLYYQKNSSELRTEKASMEWSELRDPRKGVFWSRSNDETPTPQFIKLVNNMTLENAKEYVGWINDKKNLMAKMIPVVMQARQELATNTIVEVKRELVAPHQEIGVPSASDYDFVMPENKIVFFFFSSKCTRCEEMAKRLRLISSIVIPVQADINNPIKQWEGHKASLPLNEDGIKSLQEQYGLREGEVGEILEKLLEGVFPRIYVKNNKTEKYRFFTGVQETQKFLKEVEIL